MSKKIILASQSPRRRAILQQFKLKFRSINSNIDEGVFTKLPIRQQVKQLALAKAQTVTDQLKQNNNMVVIGADTLVALGEQILAKPKTQLEARQMLKQISGQRVKVVSGLAVIDVARAKKFVKINESWVSLKKMSDKEIDWYIASKEPMDKAGAFAIQGLGARFIKSIEGDFFAIVGLSIIDLVALFLKIGIEI